MHTPTHINTPYTYLHTPTFCLNPQITNLLKLVPNQDTDALQMVFEYVFDQHGENECFSHEIQLVGKPVESVS